MLNYFRYVQQNIIRRKAIWVSVGLYWLYLSLILVFVPLIVDLPPTSLWNNTIVDLQSFSILILSVCCSIIAVVIFREGRDDGSELIILSKSITRLKIILVKFISFLLTIFVTTIISMLIMLCVLFFGKYDIVKNPDGVAYKDLLNMELGLFLATTIIALFFGSIAILISTVASKVIIMITTIGTAIIFNIIYMLVPILSVTPDDYVNDKYSVGLISNRYMGIDGTMHDVVTSDHIRRSDNPDENYDTLKYVNDGVAHSTGELISYINVAQQLTSLFHAFDSSTKNLEHSAFGEQFIRRYWLPQDKIIFDDPTTNSRPWIQWDGEIVQGVSRMNWTVYGCDLDSLSIYSISNATSDSFLYVRPIANDILGFTSTDFYSLADLMKFSNKEAENKVKAYVSKLEAEGFGYNPEVATFGNKSDRDLRERFAKDIFENENSDIYYKKSDFPLPYSIEINNSNYNKSMNANFLTIWTLIVQDIEKEIWVRIENALEAWKGDHNDGLPPFDQWTDSGDGLTIYARLTSEAKPTWKALSEAQKAKRKWYLNASRMYAFTTNPNDIVDNQICVDQDNLIRILDHIYNTSDVFSSTYVYEQKPYYDGISLTIFWSCFALLLFGATAIVYARTDIK